MQEVGEYTGVTNYRCTYCLRQSLKQTILQKPINNILFNRFNPSMLTNDICFKIKFNLLKLNLYWATLVDILNARCY